MFDKKYARLGRAAVLCVLAVSLSGCYLSLGGRGKKDRNGSPANNVVVPVVTPGMGGGYAPQPYPQQQGVQTLQPTNR